MLFLLFCCSEPGTVCYSCFHPIIYHNAFLNRLFSVNNDHWNCDDIYLLLLWLAINRIQIHEDGCRVSRRYFFYLSSIAYVAWHYYCWHKVLSHSCFNSIRFITIRSNASLLTNALLLMMKVESIFNITELIEKDIWWKLKGKKRTRNRNVRLFNEVQNDIT